MIKVIIKMGVYREDEIMLPTVPRVGDGVFAGDTISGKVIAVAWMLRDPSNIHVIVRVAE